MGNFNPVLSAQPACGDGSNHVSYGSAPSNRGGTVSIITCGQPDKVSQKLEILRSGSTPPVDDILVDLRHQGNFTSWYSTG